MGGEEAGGVETSLVGGTVVRGSQHSQLPLSLLCQEAAVRGGEAARPVLPQDVVTEELLVQPGRGPGEPQVGQADRQALHCGPLQQRGVVALAIGLAQS